MALALALESGEILSLVGAQAAKKKCKPKCPVCKKCKDGKCKKKNGGLCATDAICKKGKCVCIGDRHQCDDGTCCDQGKECNPNGVSIDCTDCVPGQNPCIGTSSQCGTYGPDKNDKCRCVTSIGGRTTCSSFASTGCGSCTTDAECEGQLGEGVPTVCVAAACECPPGSPNYCAVDGCFLPGQ
jgi:hypothetical protein